MGSFNSKKIIPISPILSNNINLILYGSNNNTISPHRNYGNVSSPINILTTEQVRECHYCGYKLSRTMEEWTNKGWGYDSPPCNYTTIYIESKLRRF